MPARSADQKPSDAWRFGNVGGSIISVSIMPNRERYAHDIVHKDSMSCSRKAGDSPIMAIVRPTGQRSASFKLASQNATGDLAWAMDPTSSTEMHAHGRAGSPEAMNANENLFICDSIRCH